MIYLSKCHPVLAEVVILAPRSISNSSRLRKGSYRIGAPLVKKSSSLRIRMFGLGRCPNLFACIWHLVSFRSGRNEESGEPKEYEVSKQSDWSNKFCRRIQNRLSNNSRWEERLRHVCMHRAQTVAKWVRLILYQSDCDLAPLFSILQFWLWAYYNNSDCNLIEAYHLQNICTATVTAQGKIM